MDHKLWLMSMGVCLLRLVTRHHGHRGFGLIVAFGKLVTIKSNDVHLSSPVCTASGSTCPHKQVLEQTACQISAFSPSLLLEHR